MEYKILQLPIEHPNTFMNADWCLAHGGINLSEYQTVYTGVIPQSWDSVEYALDRLYSIFNTQHPKDYTGRSLSVSDMITIQGIGTFFCDSFGWKQI